MYSCVSQVFGPKDYVLTRKLQQRRRCHHGDGPAPCCKKCGLPFPSQAIMLRMNACRSTTIWAFVSRPMFRPRRSNANPM